MVPSMSSNRSLLPARPSREVILRFGIGSATGSRPTSGARLARRTVRLAAALGSGAKGSAVPTSSASTASPRSRAVSRHGFCQTPVALLSNCIGPLPAASTRSSPSSASSGVPGSDEKAASIMASLCSSASQSKSRIADCAGVAVSVARPLSGASSVSVACAARRPDGVSRSDNASLIPS